MLVIVMKDQMLTPRQVCQSCLLADSNGQPRWRQGQLCCGHTIGKLTDKLPDQYECLMGFRVVNIE